jgi:WD40 repeat protein
VFAVTDQSRVEMWDREARNRVRTIHRDVPRHQLTFSPDGKSLVASIVGTAASSVDFWDRTTGAKGDRFSLPPNTFKCMAYSPEGRHLAVGNSDGTITILQLASSAGRWGP